MRVGVQLAGQERGTECDPKIFWSRMDKSGFASKTTPGSCPVVRPFLNSVILGGGSWNAGPKGVVLCRTVGVKRRFSGEPRPVSGEYAVLAGDSARMSRVYRCRTGGVMRRQEDGGERMSVRYTLAPTTSRPHLEARVAECRDMWRQGSSCIPMRGV